MENEEIDKNQNGAVDIPISRKNMSTAEVFDMVERIVVIHRQLIVPKLSGLTDLFKAAKQLNRLYFDCQSMKVREAIAHRLIRLNYPELVTKSLKQLNNMGVFRSDDIWFCTFYLYNCAWNFSDCSRRFSRALVNANLFSLLQLNLCHQPYLQNLFSKNVHYLIKASLSILINMLRVGGCTGLLMLDQIRASLLQLVGHGIDKIVERLKSVVADATGDTKGSATATGATNTSSSTTLGAGKADETGANVGDASVTATDTIPNENEEIELIRSLACMALGYMVCAVGLYKKPLDVASNNKNVNDCLYRTFFYLIDSWRRIHNSVKRHIGYSNLEMLQAIQPFLTNLMTRSVAVELTKQSDRDETAAAASVTAPYASFELPHDIVQLVARQFFPLVERLIFNCPVTANGGGGSVANKDSTHAVGASSIARDYWAELVHSYWLLVSFCAPCRADWHSKHDHQKAELRHTLLAQQRHLGLIDNWKVQLSIEALFWDLPVASTTAVNENGHHGEVLDVFVLNWDSEVELDLHMAFASISRTQPAEQSPQPEETTNANEKLLAQNEWVYPADRLLTFIRREMRLRTASLSSDVNIGTSARRTTLATYLDQISNCSKILLICLNDSLLNSPICRWLLEKIDFGTAKCRVVPVLTQHKFRVGYTSWLGRLFTQMDLFSHLVVYCSSTPAPTPSFPAPSNPTATKSSSVSSYSKPETLPFASENSKKPIEISDKIANQDGWPNVLERIRPLLRVQLDLCAEDVDYRNFLADTAKSAVQKSNSKCINDEDISIENCSSTKCDLSSEKMINKSGDVAELISSDELPPLVAQMTKYHVQKWLRMNGIIEGADTVMRNWTGKELLSFAKMKKEAPEYWFGTFMREQLGLTCAIKILRLAEAVRAIPVEEFSC